MQPLRPVCRGGWSGPSAGALSMALVASTLNAAWSLDRADSVGSLEVGKLMDAVIVRGSLTELLRVGTNTIRNVIKRGRIVS